MSTPQIEGRIMSERRPQGPPPTPGNPQFVVVDRLSELDWLVDVVEAAAKQRGVAA